ncbi:MAG: ATP-binding cassette domain-containing protein [Lachnospiraceae bacterium]
MQIHVNHITKQYKRKKEKQGFINNLKSFFHTEYEYINAVNDINFEITQGEIVGYIGSNGSGKSTTIKMLCGILTPDKGEVTIDGQIVNIKNRTLKKNIGVVFGQRSNLWNDLPASDTFQLFKYIYEIDDRQFEENYRFIDQFLNISEIKDVAVRKLSLGQRMKCEICASMLHFPDLLFLDEPTIGLDVNIRKSVLALLKEYNRKFHKTILITSHNLFDIEELCSRVIIIDHGKILAENSVEGIKNLYQKYKLVEIQYADENALSAGIQYVQKLSEVQVESDPQLNKQICQIMQNDDQTMNQLMQYIIQNKDVVNFQVYQESLESIIGNIIG